jgi:hypothetical protein
MIALPYWMLHDHSIGLTDVDIARALTFPRAAPHWVQCCTLFAMLHVGVLFPILGMPLVSVIVGYALDVVRNAHDNADIPLPQWQRLGPYFVRGCVAIAGCMICILGLIGPLLVLARLSRPASGPGALEMVGIATWGIVAVIAGLLAFPGAIARYAGERRMTGMFDIQRIAAEARGAPWVLVSTVFAAIAISSIALIVGLLGFVFLVFITIPWATLVIANLLGQAYRIARRVDESLAGSP